MKSDCRAHKLVRKLGLQKQCTYIGILENSASTHTRHFSVSLSTSSPHVIFNTQRATIFIMEGTETTARPTVRSSTPALMDASTTLASTTSSPTEIPTTSSPTERPSTEKPKASSPSQRPASYSPTNAVPTDKPTTSKPAGKATVTG